LLLLFKLAEKTQIKYTFKYNTTSLISYFIGRKSGAKKILNCLSVSKMQNRKLIPRKNIYFRVALFSLPDLFYYYYCGSKCWHNRATFLLKNMTQALFATANEKIILGIS
jgi:hypothetical protein